MEIESIGWRWGSTIKKINSGVFLIHFRDIRQRTRQVKNGMARHARLLV